MKTKNTNPIAPPTTAAVTLLPSFSGSFGATGGGGGGTAAYTITFLLG